MKKVLIIDDDRALNESFARLLTQEGYAVETAFSGEEGIAKVKAAPPNLAVVDLRLPGIDGMETFQIIHRLHPKLPVVIFTAYGSTDIAIDAIKQGAFDYIHKPFEVPEMLRVIEKGIEAERFMHSPVVLGPETDNPFKEAIVGRSDAMLSVYKAVGRVSPTDATVLIRGESGTGKELVARSVYHHSLRSEKPFLVINCVAIPETLLESELFGYEKGAFTGATHRKIGKIEQANHGTVFLDEIGDMPVAIQGKLLRLLQEKSIERIGGKEVIPVDVRIVAATNRDLEKAVADGQFREDLYYRLNVVTIPLPPLRQRAEDIPLLADYLLAFHAGNMGVKKPVMDKHALRALTAYHWPGNIRQLSNVIQKVLIFNQGAPIRVQDVESLLDDDRPARESDPEPSDNGLRLWARQMLQADQFRDNCFEAGMDRVAAILVREALNMTDGNRSRAARLLGISRPTLHAKMEKYTINVHLNADPD